MKTSKLVTLGLTALLFSCSSDDYSSDNDNDDTGTDNPTENVLSVALESNATFGNILTDTEGLSLYFFSKDVAGDSQCSDGCLNAWPVFYSEDPTLGNDLAESDFSEITREDGSKQTTFKGWPLYYFASDSGAGDTSGDGVGDNWFIAKPDYSLMYAQIEDTFYMTNATGRAVYTFANDAFDTNNFTNEDFSNNSAWPIIGLDISIVPSILNVEDFSEIDIFGNTQVTYKGNPLYYFGNDTERGDTNGVSGVWPLASVDTPALEEVVNSVLVADNSTFGSILTDSEGLSLYFFSKDVAGDSQCAGGCLAAWPAYYSANPTLDNDLSEADFGVITREDGEKQSTYKGWPLYYFASDSGAGATDGDGVGGNWFIAKPDYSLMYAQAEINGVDTFYMTNATGRTIYAFANDTVNDNNFTNEDFSNNSVWPIIGLEITRVPSILNLADFSEIDVFGNIQVTYKGNPLYYFGNDTLGGDVNGVSGAWPIVNLDTPAKN